jgi:hypothetical protein
MEDSAIKRKGIRMADEMKSKDDGDTTRNNRRVKQIRRFRKPEGEKKKTLMTIDEIIAKDRREIDAEVDALKEMIAREELRRCEVRKGKDETTKGPSRVDEEIETDDEFEEIEGWSWWDKDTARDEFVGDDVDDREKYIVLVQVEKQYTTE